MGNLEYNYEAPNKDLQYIKSIKDKLFSISHMMVEDRNMVEVLKLATKVSRVDTTVLILGETGVGKEGIAKYIHYSSFRKDEPFITINCGAIPPNLIESELFGYEGGAMKSIEVDVRILAATNRDLKELIQRKQFREDLYYRLSVFPIEIPPLRERKGDIIPLINYFTNTINEKYNFNCSFNEEAIDCLYSYEWKGNVRELRNVIERNIIINDKKLIEKEDLPPYIGTLEIQQEFILSINNFSIKGYSLKDIIQKIEREIIEDFLLANNYAELSKEHIISIYKDLF